MKTIVGITGGSGAPYALRLIEVLAEHQVEVHLVVSRAGAIVVHQELGWPEKPDCESVSNAIREHLEARVPGARLLVHDNSDVGASIASGSFVNNGMVVVPCSMSMLAAINAGLASDLVSRAASVMIKERRTLIVVPREMPLSEIHLRNMLELCRMGVRILAPMPGFYHRPKSIDDLVSFVVGRILDGLGIQKDLYERWHGLQASTPSSVSNV